MKTNSVVKDTWEYPVINDCYSQDSSEHLKPLKMLKMDLAEFKASPFYKASFRIIMAMILRNPISGKERETNKY